MIFDMLIIDYFADAAYAFAIIFIFMLIFFWLRFLLSR